MDISLILLIVTAGLTTEPVKAGIPGPRPPRVPPLKLLEHLYSMQPSIADQQEASLSTGSAVEHNVNGFEFENLLGSVLAELESLLLASAQAQKMFREVSRYGLPGFDGLKFRANYVASYNNRQKHPNWVMEHMTSMSLRREKPAENPFHIFVTDDTTHEYFRANEYDYRRTGYDRGHLSPAFNNMFTTEMLNQAYCFLNVAPQVRQLNRCGCPWARLESYVRHIALHAIHTYVVTGTLYLPSHVLHGNNLGRLDDVLSYRVIGPNRVGVPSHFYKVIVYETKFNQMSMEAFIMPNYPQVDERADLSLFRVDIETGLVEIEEAAGLKFFEPLNRSKVIKPNILMYGYNDQVQILNNIPMLRMMPTPYYWPYW